MIFNDFDGFSTVSLFLLGVLEFGSFMGTEQMGWGFCSTLRVRPVLATVLVVL